ncbi:MAG: hypothetical protein LBL49_04695 [Clostridiales Family XIII bacterium]|jgi:hypothetical protein|nr:hypothetical protein [Clostridiales Family XIII bacterium]
MPAQYKTVGGTGSYGNPDGVRGSYGNPDGVGGTDAPPAGLCSGVYV